MNQTVISCFRNEGRVYFYVTKLFLLGFIAAAVLFGSTHEVAGKGGAADVNLPSGGRRHGLHQHLTALEEIINKL